ncbi:hypothetical protein RvY_06224 [Ramazzottius varieornatus]|uniref:Uncharacterized protein n=1 Tax=Ramazzottius varieornatus TaxID=947166 RepID=A0A1D1V6L2_RAMVA|nr:hypothetical protein RvY_06224 [Ramazzottius varieornatus]
MAIRKTRLIKPRNSVVQSVVTNQVVKLDLYWLKKRKSRPEPLVGKDTFDTWTGLYLERFSAFESTCPCAMELTA